MRCFTWTRRTYHSNHPCKNHVSINVNQSMNFYDKWLLSHSYLCGDSAANGKSWRLATRRKLRQKYLLLLWPRRRGNLLSEGKLLQTQEANLLSISKHWTDGFKVSSLKMGYFSQWGETEYWKWNLGSIYGDVVGIKKLEDQNNSSACNGNCAKN